MLVTDKVRVEVRALTFATNLLRSVRGVHQIRCDLGSESFRGVAAET